MQDDARLGGSSAIAWAALLLVGVVLLGIPFASAPPEALAAEAHAGRLGFIANLTDGQRTLMGIGIALEFAAALFLAVAVAGLYVWLRRDRRDESFAALVLGMLAVPLFLLEHLPRWSLLQLGSLWGRAGEAERAGLAAAYALAEGNGIVAGSMFTLFFAVALIAFGSAFRRAGSDRLGVAALVIGALGIIAAAAPLASSALGFFQFPVLILFALWTLAAGMVVLRATAGARAR